MTPASPLTEIFKLSEPQKKALARLNLHTAGDLLTYFPSRYGDIGELKNIADVQAGETVTLFGKILNPKTKKGFRSKIPMGQAELEDLSGKIQIIWFNQAYLAKMVQHGSSVKVTGKVSDGKHGLYLSNPEFETGKTLPIDVHDSLFQGKEFDEDVRYPVYPETRGISSSWIYHHIQRLFRGGILDHITEYIPAQILERYHLPTLKTALVWIHAPRKEKDSIAARKRFAFEEIFLIQLRRQRERREYEENTSYAISIPDPVIQEFLDRFPFSPTEGQKTAIQQIISDMSSLRPMARLLEGDVGSGKTAVAATAAFAAVKTRPNDKDFGNLQVAYMAPTEILATQHFESFIQYFAHMGIQVGLLTGSGCRKFPSKVNPKESTPISRAQLLKWVKNGEIPIVVGTHALIQKSVEFKHLGLVVVDEQHRFGALQRAKLAKKEGFAPHFLSMTATPIPRTLALTIYGDLDLSVLDQMPQGRKPVKTEIVTPEKRQQAYDAIQEEMNTGRQLYVICPRINEPDPTKEQSLNVKSVTAEAERLKKVFKGKTIGILHSKLTKEKKETVMQSFAEGEVDILVATSVVEVGVNVPNATMIIIEGAERFGLAQLHQLRGRVVRSTHQAYCYIFADTKTKKTIDRLKALTNAANGFELAELDLSLRGAGELSGKKQWGVTDLGMEAIRNIKMVEAAREEAKLLVSKDPQMKNHQDLWQTVERRTENIHFE